MYACVGIHPHFVITLYFLIISSDLFLSYSIAWCSLRPKLYSTCVRGDMHQLPFRAVVLSTPSPAFIVWESLQRLAEETGLPGSFQLTQGHNCALRLSSADWQRPYPGEKHQIVFHTSLQLQECISAEVFKVGSGELQGSFGLFQMDISEIKKSWI